MEEHAAIPCLRETVIFLIAAKVIVPFLPRLRVRPRCSAKHDAASRRDDS